MLTFIACRDPYGDWLASLEVECARLQAEHELELDLQRKQELDWEEPQVIGCEIVDLSSLVAWDAYSMPSILQSFDCEGINKAEQYIDVA